MPDKNPPDFKGPHMLCRIKLPGIHLELFFGLSLGFLAGVLPWVRRVLGIPATPALPLASDGSVPAREPR